MSAIARHLSPQARGEYAAARWGRARNLRLEFPDWLPAVTPAYNWQWPYLRHMLGYIDMVTRREIDRLMIFLPPRHSKSETVTIRYPAWFLEHNPESRVIVGAYNQTLANKFSRKTRRITAGRISLNQERTAVDDWETAAGGGLRAVGVGGGITGFGGNLIIVDDPVKSREEAASPTYRQRVWDWYTDDLYTRREPGAAMILIMTRWHEDDLAGRILRSEDGPNWTAVKLPALAQEGDPLGRRPGEALCPDRFDEKALAEAQRVLGRSFHALYQQEPQEQEGEMFKRSNFQFMDADEIPADTSWLWYWDKAATSKGGDYSAGVKMGSAPDGRYIIADVKRGQWGTDERDQLCLSVMQMEGPAVPHHFESEGGSSGRDVQTYQARIFTGYPVFFRTPTGSKEVRAQPFSAQVEAHNVYLVRAPWNEHYIDELCTFPNAANDDQVDASSGAFNGLATAGTLEAW